jgi:lipopolysaccharide export system protein LptA
MQLTIEKLRRWMLVGATVIVAVVGVLLLIAQHERRKLARDLPEKLGMDIQQQTNEFTYSQSVQGRTLFTLHAAKAVQMKSGGNIKLHDVTIILYGRNQDRADRIAGQEFDYDPNSGIARAQGDVFLDLQAPAKAVAASVKSPAAVDATKDLADTKGGAGVVHVTTSGLVFEQKDAVAYTDQEIAFQFGGGVTGHAHGARYDSGHGTITLDSAVAADAMLHGRKVRLTAAHGVLNRDSDLCVFTHATYMAQGETATADQATVQMRSDGSAESVDTSGNVTMTLASGGTLRTPHAVLALSESSEPKELEANNGVVYSENEHSDNESAAAGAREAHGDAASAHIFFGEHGVAQRAELSGGVHTLEREKTKSAAGWTERELHAATVEMDFRTDHGAASVLHEVKASGDARMRLAVPESQTTTLAGDTLDAVFGTRAATLPETVHGMGHTVLTQTAADGTVSESRGDTLNAQMHPGGAKQAKAGTNLSQIDRAIQQGHVAITQTPVAKNGQSSQAMTATAERAEYTGSDDALVLTGTPQVAPQLTDGGMQIAAQRIRMLRTSGDAVLTGDVRGNYAGAGAQSAAHIVADHAEMHRASRHAVFYGAGKQQRARLWQDASQVEAPVLDFDRAAQRLTASGDAHDAAAVHAVFASTPAANAAQKKTDGVVRVSSRRMVYFAQAAGTAPRQADFTGGVAVESGDGTISAQRALVELAPAEKNTASQSAGPLPVLGGNVQRITASGQVTLEQSGRQGFGEQLVYIPNTAPSGTPNAGTPNPAAAGANPNKGSGHFVLTGTPAAPPRLVDPEKGSVTGSSLIFNSGDDSVVVSGSGAISGGSGTAGRVHTELKGSR